MHDENFLTKSKSPFKAFGGYLPREQLSQKWLHHHLYTGSPKSIHIHDWRPVGIKHHKVVFFLVSFAPWAFSMKTLLCWLIWKRHLRVWHHHRAVLRSAFAPRPFLRRTKLPFGSKCSWLKTILLKHSGIHLHIIRKRLAWKGLVVKEIPLCHHYTKPLSQRSLWLHTVLASIQVWGWISMTVTATQRQTSELILARFKNMPRAKLGAKRVAQITGLIIIRETPEQLLHIVAIWNKKVI